MTFEMKRDEGAAIGAKRYHFALSRRGMLGFVVGAVVCLAWVFVLGVLIGRGYQPEKQVPELATLMPASKGVTAQLTQKKSENESKVIPPEELNYYANLKGESRSKKPSKPVHTSASAKKTNEEPAKELSASASARPKPVKHAEAEKLKTVVPASPKATEAMAAPEKARKKKAPIKPGKQAAASSKPKQPAAVASVKPEAENVQARPGVDGPVKTTKENTAAQAEVDTQLYDYVYQIASLQNADAALRFRDKVKKLGLKAEVNVVQTNSKTWHRVVVHFRGMPEDTRDMKKKLQQVGVDKPLMKSKKPI